VQCSVQTSVEGQRLYGQIDHFQNLFKQWPELSAESKCERWIVHNADVIIAAAEQLTGKKLTYNKLS
jgi:hypothetical protein